MVTSKFVIRFKRHQQYLYISILLISIFFIGSSLITPKVTSVTENLIEDLIYGNLKSKENVVAFEFNQLHSYILEFKKNIENKKDLSKIEVEKQLEFVAELTESNKNITNSFVYYNLDSLSTIISDDLISKKNIESHLKTQNQFILDTIINYEKRVVNRKLYVNKTTNNQITVIGYDIDLLLFWEYFSEMYKGDGGYTVVTNKDGICLLHPEPKNIGQKLNRYFNNVSIEKILDNSIKINGYYVPNKVNVLKDKVISNFLGLEVLRYFDTIEVGNSPLIIVANFPLEIHLKETTQDIQRYFSWISFLAFITFMLILVVSRIQLKKEYFDNLKILGEKKQLVNTNEKYQKENALLQLSQLKKKMNPHFLFNSLNSLHVLIDLNPELSQQFVLKLSDVYRYLLDDRDGNLISVKKEITFLEQYVFLQEIRFNNSLKVSIKNKCNDEVLKNKIPFLSLETLVENAIKHNEITKQNPLEIDVVIFKDCIKVINNYTPRKNKEANSHHIGLNYLENTYQFYQINTFKTEIKEEKFICVLPYII